MKVKISFIKIKDIEKLFTKEGVVSELFGDRTGSVIEKCIANEYLDDILSKLQLTKVIDSYSYLGEIGRIAKYNYEVVSCDNTVSVIFTLDSLNDSHYMEVELESNPNANYDLVLEKLKLEIKKNMLKDWVNCIWIRDEQSEDLAAQLYRKMHIVENLFRELINKVLNRELGTDWLAMEEFQKINNEYKARTVDFKRSVKSFSNIDDSLISINTDSLVKIMKTVIYEDEIDLNHDVQKNLKLKARILESNDKFFESIKKLWKVRIDLWNDVFAKMLDENFNIGITDFIKNRNHIAHNKLVDYNSFKKIKDNIDSMETVFVNAIEKVNQHYMSNEAIMTIEAEEVHRLQEEHYLLNLKMSEAGVNILDYNSIYQKFACSVQEIYVGINDEFYFSEWINISSLSMTENTGDEQAVFSISNHVNEEDTIVVYVSYNIDDCEGVSSELEIKVKNGEVVINKIVVEYKNGSVIFDEDAGYYLSENEDEYNDSEIDEFVNELSSYVEDEMNSIKKEVDSLHACIPSEELGSTVAESVCYSCGKEYISVNEEIYPYGKCINCGEENSIKECIRCCSLFNSDVEGMGDLCDSCYDFVMNE
ncbi:hypothetical protein SAMN02745751_03448 [Dethiosulfatibacter aminovorans DSM 17477]|uniref:Apea-like HEPN domain-containing protein n=1 Tax=Dethiosulfatibacter aminovorans DSM 17477 TaxID=1121476 RepID=A0A1M6ME89_9FIRM|nr:hypothetical protein [Dethiosulfatibacter aminovorans]SHJ81791.1 hypothetical protein SAMN02745751_03448 [Dethiosulfatibacter aminovorans DSM 17477]